jgi:TRAP-type mannitol/chloroaromatic compound transport system permease small subunit
MNILEKYINIVESINKKLGTITSWLTLILVLIITYDVIVRYIFDSSSVALQELEWHLFAVIFLLAAGYTFLIDDHVRVDVFYTRYSERNKAITNLIGSLIFLIPFCIVGILSSLNFVEFSFRVKETSPDAGGLPARYILKSFIPLSLFILLLQGFAIVFRSILKLKTGKTAKGLQN